MLQFQWYVASLRWSATYRNVPPGKILTMMCNLLCNQDMIMNISSIVLSTFGYNSFEYKMGFQMSRCGLFVKL